MGHPKQLLPINGRPMLAEVCEPLLACSMVEGALIVTHRAIADALCSLAGPHFKFVLNDDPESEMIDSIRLGTQTLQQMLWLHPVAGVLIVPGDQPGLQLDDVERCCRCWSEQPESIVIATHEGRRGHPLILPASLFAAVEGPVCDEGLRALIEAETDRIVYVASENPAVVRNLNTPQEYQDYLHHLSLE